MKTTILVLAAIFSVNSFALEFSPQFEIKEKELGFSFQVNDFKFYQSNFNETKEYKKNDHHKKSSTNGFSWMPKFKANKFFNVVSEIGLETRKFSEEKNYFENNEIVLTESYSKSKTSLKLGLGLESYKNFDKNFGLKFKAGFENFDMRKEVNTKASVGLVFKF